MKRFLNYNKKLKTRAQELRKNMTALEKKLWYEFLRDLRLKSPGVSFEEEKSPSIPLDKGEVAADSEKVGVDKGEEQKSPSIPLDKGEVAADSEKVPLTKGEASESEQGDGYRVRVLRQRPIGNFIVDFYIPTHTLVIEIDGESHFSEQGKDYDRERTEFLNGLGITVLRFTNREVMEEFEGVCERIVQILHL